MKKGIVMQIKYRQMIILTKDGKFVRAKLKADAEIGEEVEYSAVPPFNIVSKVLESKMYSVPVAMLLFLLLLVPLFPFFQTETVHGYVSLDINPSIELALDDDFEIIYITGYNDKGNELINHIDTTFEKMNLVSATTLILREGYKQGLVDPLNSIYISSSLPFIDDSQWGEDFQKWSSAISTEFNVDIYSIYLDERTTQEAKDLAVSPVKYILYKTNQQIDHFDSNAVSNTSLYELEKNVEQSIEDLVHIQQLTEKPGKVNNNNDRNSNVNDKQKKITDRESNNNSENDRDIGGDDDEPSMNPANKESHPKKDEHPGQGNPPFDKHPSQENR